MYLEKTLDYVASKKCKIEVFGLGYVGFPLSIRLANSNFKVLGVDKNSSKIKELENKILKGTQLRLETQFLESIQNGYFAVSEKSLKSDFPKVGIIAVSTPYSENKINSNIFVNSAVEEFLGTSSPGDVIILESSIGVGTTEKIEKIINSFGYDCGKNFGLCFCPERIDPLNKKWKLENIPRVIFASDDITFRIAQEIYKNVNNGNLIRVSSSKIAEVVKSFENTFRMVNISLVNELAILCDKLKINVKEVLDASSTKPFGFMPFYPGAGAGGHCIPKDPRFLIESGKSLGFNFSSIENAININFQIPNYIVNSIEKSLEELKLQRSVLVCGLSYKPDIEDMRDSPGFKILYELHRRNIDFLLMILILKMIYLICI